MGDTEIKSSELFYRLAGISAIVLVCVPLTSLILSALIKIEWGFIGFVCVFAAAGIVICLGIGGIISLISE